MSGTPDRTAAPGGEQRLGLRSLLPYLRPHRTALATAAALALVGAATALAQPQLVRTLLELVAASRPVGGTLALLVAVIVVDGVVSGLQQYLLQRTGEGVVLGARRSLAARLLRLPVTEYDARRTGDLISRVGADTTALRAVVTSGLVELVGSVVVLVGAVVAMLLLDPLLLGVTALAVTLGLSVVVAVSRRIQQLSREAQDRVGELTADVDRVLSAVRTIRSSRAEEREDARFDRSARAAYDAGVRTARLQALVSPGTTVALQGSFLAVLGLGGARVAAGDLSVADLIAFVLYLFLLVMPLGQGIGAYTTLQAGLGALQRIQEVGALPLETADDAAAVPAAWPVGRRAPELSFEDVDFAYPDGIAVLHGVTFTAPAGRRTALVGPSGAGKSTLLALVERFYDVTSGSVRLDGVDVRDVPRDALRARIGYVEQEAPVLAGSIAENLRLADPEADDARLRAALDLVNLGGLVDRAAGGLDAPVGEEGVLLSGGERQRLALARVLLSAPALILLDEPTANLDARNEQALREAVDAVSASRTVLVVAHRLSTVVDADRIVVLDAGRVVGVGTHAELVDASPLYRELASRQLLVPADPQAITWT